MSRQKKIVRLNFKSFDKQWMLNYANTHLNENRSPTPWKTDLMYFLTDWFSQAETIRATTSGSTGRPKSIDLSKKSMEASARATINFFDLKPGNTAMLSLPIKYIAAKMMVVRSDVGQLDLYCTEPSLNPVSEWTPELDFAAFTPAQFSKLLKSTEGRLFVSRIKKVLLGGGPLPVSLEDRTKTLETEIWHSYGMTETMSHVALRKVNRPDATDRFYPMDGVKLSLAKENCLKITAPNLNIYDLVTHDIATLDEKGGFKILGRKDNVINSGGVKLFPESIERKIASLLDVPFYITGRKHPEFGQVPVLVVESERWPFEKRVMLQKGLLLLPEQFEIPKEIMFEPKFRRTESGKIIRKSFEN